MLSSKGLQMTATHPQEEIRACKAIVRPLSGEVAHPRRCTGAQDT